MRHTLVIGIVSILSIGSAFGQGTVKLRFADSSSRDVWAAPGWPPEPSPNLIKVVASSTDFSTAGSKPTDFLCVLDEKSGNLAVKALKDVAGSWTVAGSDYQAVGKVRFRIEHQGKPLAGGTINVDDGRRPQAKFLDPSVNGQVEFTALTPGPIRATVHFHIGGKDAPPVTQVFDLKLQRLDAEPTFAISIPDEVATVGDTAPGAAGGPAAGGDGSSGQLKQDEKKGDKATTPPIDKTVQSTNASTKDAATKDAGPGRPSAGGNILWNLIVLALVIGGAYLAYMWIKKNQDRVQTQLEKMGVQVPKPADPGPPPTAVPLIKQPPAKIILGEPDPASTSSSIPVASAATFASASPRPRMVRDNGEEVYLQEGATVVGREPGLGISIVDETTISRRHAEVVKTGDEAVVRDLGSTNGTFVNGVKVTSDTVLKVGDTVQFGSVRFKYEV